VIHGSDLLGGDDAASLFSINAISILPINSQLIVLCQPAIVERFPSFPPSGRSGNFVSNTRPTVIWRAVGRQHSSVRATSPIRTRQVDQPLGFSEGVDKILDDYGIPATCREGVSRGWLLISAKASVAERKASELGITSTFLCVARWPDSRVTEIEGSGSLSA
jgi:hypothetical protein